MAVSEPREDRPGRLGGRFERLLDGPLGAPPAVNLRGIAPRLDRQLRGLDHERDALRAAFGEALPGSVPVAALFERLQSLARADTAAVFESYWRDLGGEG